MPDAIFIFAATYLVLAVGRIPFLRVDRTGWFSKPSSPSSPTRCAPWLALAMSSTLAGNLTLPGSVANLMVVQRARGEVEISFREYARAGVPLTVLSLAAGV